MSIKNNRRFENRVAIITGSGKGMGKQVALDMALEGAKVVVTDIDAPAMEKTVEELSSLNCSCIGQICDVTDSSAVEKLVFKVVNAWGHVDILVNNAGYLTVGTIEEMSDDIISQTLNVNIAGVLYFIRAVTPYFKKQRYGKILNVASVTGKNGDNSTFPVYGGSKGAVISLTRSIARQLGSFNINCNAIAPHAVMTEMMNYWDEERKRAAISKIPIGRLGTVQDMSQLMMFLVSDQSSYITGETVNINGGFYMD